MAALAELITDTSIIGDDGKRLSAQVIHCSYCKAFDTLRGHGLVSVEFAKKKFTQRGWDIHKKAACPRCVVKFKAQSAARAEQKVVPMVKPITPVQPAAKPMRSLAELSLVAAVKPAPSETAPREMSPLDRRKVFRAIDEVWDENTGRYGGGATDNRIAEQLNVPRAWVEDVRRESFGDAGDNQDLVELRAALDEASKHAEGLMNEALALATKFEAIVAELGAVRGRCSALEKAVGLRK